MVSGGQFTSPSFDLHDQIRGEKSGDDPDERVLLNQAGVPERTVCATSRRHHGEYSGARLLRCFPIPRRPSESSWRAGPENTAAYIWRRAYAIRRSLQQRGKWKMGSIWALWHTPRIPQTKRPQRIIRRRIYETVYLASAGNPHAGCEVAGAGNGLTVRLAAKF
jgi:hypothetical protein